MALRSNISGSSYIRLVLPVLYSDCSVQVKKSTSWSGLVVPTDSAKVTEYVAMAVAGGTASAITRSDWIACKT